MKLFNVKFAAALVAAVGGFCAIQPAFADDAATWPTRDVRMVVPYPPGGLADSVTRIIAEQMAKDTGYGVVVENKPGANGQIGLNEVIRAPKDGHTLGLIVPATMITLPLTDPNYKIKPLSQLEPLTIAVDTYLTLVVNPESGAKSIKEFVEYAKSQKEPLMYGIPGIGSSFHFNNVTMAHKLGYKATSVPYTGESAILIDIAGGHIDYALVSNAGKTYIEGGKVTPLAVTSRKRVSALPDVPTFKELGYDFVSDGWVGYAAAAGTPQPVLDKVSAALVKALKAPRVQELLGNMGYTVTANSRHELTELIIARGRSYSDVIKSGQIVLKEE
ncbi:tripartite tricarboxylate transporter substrate binding protein [Pusillimonas sp. TS35]|uniref:Bug family tripartite tricarboxylate transporter substrate binding protein n=1 Tax=Paracandidimonas lactea TaxID=2895524 RepID=UPI0013696976|nr:tripartite tricarboxylate transporter substrate binding protein [Paracandidimonas lactea]MYN12751.1 tripartite tricarboxylate transporter substrate binding protein [Pusillimonas sp. TS35]